MSPGRASESPLIEICGADLGYRDHTVLRGVDLRIGPGEYWFLLGPNGSGKSTLLRTVVGLIPAIAGRVALRADLADRRHVGFVPQRCELNPALPTTVREFVSLGFVGAGFVRNERARALGEALQQTGLTGLDRCSYWDLSGGQRQRALLARALVRRPRLLIVDEPTEGLDVAAEEGFLATLDGLRRGNALTLVFVTHHLALAAHYATHVAFFHDGRVATGERLPMLRRDALRRVFGVDVELRPATDSAGEDRP